MIWQNGDGKVCKMIRDRRTGAQAEGEDFESFQRFVASLRDFERVGFVEQVSELQEHHTGRRYVATASWKTNPSILAGSISTSQRRWLLLRFFAAKFAEDDSQFYFPLPDEFSDLAGATGRITQVCEWLREKGFIAWQPMSADVGGCGQILEKGHEALDHGLEMLTERTPMQSIDQSINVGTLNAGSGDLAIGPGAAINKQVLADELTKLISAVKDGPGDEGEKKTAIARLTSALAHPLITSVVGAIVGATVS